MTERDGVELSMVTATLALRWFADTRACDRELAPIFELVHKRVTAAALVDHPSRLEFAYQVAVGLIMEGRGLCQDKRHLEKYRLGQRHSQAGLMMLGLLALGRGKEGNLLEPAQALLNALGDIDCGHIARWLQPPKGQPRRLTNEQRRFRQRVVRWALLRKQGGVALSASAADLLNPKCVTTEPARRRAAELGFRVAAHTLRYWKQEYDAELKSDEKSREKHKEWGSAIESLRDQIAIDLPACAFGRSRKSQLAAEREKFWRGVAAKVADEQLQSVA